MLYHYQLATLVAMLGLVHLGAPRLAAQERLPIIDYYLRRLVEAGFGLRIMFGSHQMVWPDAIGRAIEVVEAAPFLSVEQRRDIMCRNAARFLRLEVEVCS